jgi:hypothetical protein
LCGRVLSSATTHTYGWNVLGSEMFTSSTPVPLSARKQSRVRNVRSSSLAVDGGRPRQTPATPRQTPARQAPNSRSTTATGSARYVSPTLQTPRSAMVLETPMSSATPYGSLSSPLLPATPLSASNLARQPRTPHTVTYSQIPRSIPLNEGTCVSACVSA